MFDALGDIQGDALLQLDGSCLVSKNLGIQAGTFNLCDKNFRKHSQVRVNGTPTWVSSYFQGRLSVSGVMQAGRLFVVTTDTSSEECLKRLLECFQIKSCKRWLFNELQAISA